MMSLPDAARSYLGVRFRHRGRNRNGLDCAGLIVAVYRDLGVALPDFRKYGMEPHNDGLVTHVRAGLGDELPINSAQPGDVIVMRFEIQPHHLAIVGRHPLGHLSIIHADGHYGCVLEQGLSPDMIKRITHVFRRPV